jgi:hypothetical protein
VQVSLIDQGSIQLPRFRASRGNCATGGKRNEFGIPADIAKNFFAAQAMI